MRGNYRYSMLWGYPVETWDWWGLRLMLAGAIFGVVALALSLASSFVLYKTAAVSQADADGRIAEAVATGAKANAEAAKANEAAAKAHERTAELEKEAAQAKLEQERLRQQMAWRRVTPVQHRTVVAALAGHKFSVWVSYVGNDPEATVFREDINQTLRAAGLETKYFSGWKVAVGLQITDEPAGPERDALIAAFSLAGIPLSLTKAQMAKGELQIIVGTKPPPF